jgi:hypothetical protein
MMNQSDKTKQSWKKIKASLINVDIYSLEATIIELRKNDLHLSLKGKAKNRTLIKNNPKLYKSIMEHTKELEEAFKAQKAYKTNYNFSHRVMFLVDKDVDLESLRCKCGKKLTWTTYCRHCPDYKRTQLGRPHTEETKKKMRLSALKYISELKGQVIPRYNKDSIALIESYGKEHGYSFMHAENGGEYFVKELGYFLDGYDPIRNVAVEVDESRHFVDGELTIRDKERQRQIEDLLGCTFIRMKI